MHDASHNASHYASCDGSCDASHDASHNASHDDYHDEIEYTQYMQYMCPIYTADVPYPPFTFTLVYLVLDQLDLCWY